MTPETGEFEYDPVSVLVAWGSAAFGGVGLIFLWLFPFASVNYGYPGQSFIGTTSFLTEAAWCIASFFVAAILILIVKRLFVNLIPAWLVISFLGTLIFVLTLWPYAFWQSVRSYQPGDPFRAPPAPFDIWMWDAFGSGLFIFLSAATTSFICFLILKDWPEKLELHLDDK